MSDDKPNVELRVAVCADSGDDQAILRTYIKVRGWKESGHRYRFEQWRELIADATDRKFNTVCATYGGLRWIVRVAPETDFPKPRPKPKRTSKASMTVASNDQHQPLMIERARALTAETPQTAETIAQSLVADGLIEGTPPGTARRVRRALLQSGEFAAYEPEGGGPTQWRRWTPATGSVEQPDGRRILYTEVLSTTGVPVQIAIPVKSPKEIAEILLREVMAEQHLAAKPKTPRKHSK